MARVLVAIPTYEGHGYCFDLLAEHLRALSFAAVDFVFVDNSETEGHSERIKNAGFIVLRDVESRTRQEKILNARNTIRDYFLKGAWEHLFLVDSDVMVPSDAVERLMGHGADVATGVYLSHQNLGGKRSVNPVLYDFVDAEHARIMSVHEVLGERVMPIAAAGLGCCLIKRHVLEKVRFRVFGQATEDVAFFMDARAAGFTAVADTSVKCTHIPYPLGDARNEDVQFEHWQGTRYSYSFSLGR